jgi:predicted  nucleic acid-binding Zn-ribbon protein
MNIHNDAYPEPIVRLLNENKYLKEELREEKEKLENTIKTLNKEIEELKNKNTTLNNELTDVKVQNKSLSSQTEKCEKIMKERFYHTI